MLISTVWFIYQCWIFTQGSSLAVSFLRDLRNVTVVYKPNAFIYHLCQISSTINSKRIRWHYESLNDSETPCQNLSHNPECFEFYYGASTSVLAVKEPDIFMGKYTCRLSLNATFELKSVGWIDVKLPAHDAFDEDELGRLAVDAQVPYIVDGNDPTSFGRRVQLGGLFYTRCQSVASSSLMTFTWLHLRNKTHDKMKNIRFLQDDGKRIHIQDEPHASSLSIYSVELSDDGDYVCIASNARGQSYSSRRSLVVAERMIPPRIRDTLLNLSYFDVQHNARKELLCYADGYPIPDVRWIRVTDATLRAQNQSFALLEFDREMHGVHEYICQATNKHGMVNLVIYAIIPNMAIKPWLNFSDVQSRSVRLDCHLTSEEHADRLNHFIIYYRPWNVLDDDDEGIDHIEDYQQILVDSRFTFQVNDLIPFTQYEFRLKAFLGATPSDYSNRVLITTLDTLPDKVDQIFGYGWNRTSVVIRWTPPKFSNGPGFHYVLYYTSDASIPFNHWSNRTLDVYPYVILSVPTFDSFPLFIRVACVNGKGSVLSDFHIITDYLPSEPFIPTVEHFRCLSAETHHQQRLSLQWSVSEQSRAHIAQYLLYYTDLTESTAPLVRLLPIPIDSLSVHRYHLNTSSLVLNWNRYHLLRFHLAILDRNGNQQSISRQPIHCTFTRRDAKRYISLPISLRV